MSTDEQTLLQPGDTCRDVAVADRAAVLLDNAAYFAAVRAALLQARRQVIIVGWQFDPRTVLEPDAQGQPTTADGRIGRLLIDLAETRPELDIRVLIWRMDLPISASMEFFPLRAAPYFKASKVHFRLDRTVPLGACHHQKIVVVDDAVAFCGGGDLSVDRWDTPEHPDRDARRTMPNGKEHKPRHEVMMLVSGPAAAMLGDQARRRWRKAELRKIDPPPPADHDPWPAHVPVIWRDVRVGMALTEPAYRGAPGHLEIERLYLEAIHSARHTIVLENQYVASPVIELALDRRLGQPDGPEIVVLTTLQSPSWFDQMTMDRTRAAMIGRLRAADVYGRFRAFCPVTPGGDTIIVHSKVSIIDDRLLRIGSANLNNRSLGFDTECDVALEAVTPEARGEVAAFRTRLLSHWLGIAPEQFLAEDELGGPGLVEALDRLAARTGRMIPVEHYKQGPIRNMIALNHLGDPVEPTDSWQPWLRTGKLRRRALRLMGQSLRREGGGRRPSS